MMLHFSEAPETQICYSRSKLELLASLDTDHNTTCRFRPLGLPKEKE